MRKKRRNHSAEFKARIALEAIKGLKTVQQIAADKHLHPVQVTHWKNQMIESASGIFSKGRERAEELGVRQQAELLGVNRNRLQVARIMRLMGLWAIYRKPRTSQPNLANKVYPYLICDRVVEGADGFHGL
jgi:transposase